MFLTPIERALIRRGESEGRQAVEFVPTAFSDSPRMRAEALIGIAHPDFRDELARSISG